MVSAATAALLADFQTGVSAEDSILLRGGLANLQQHTEQQCISEGTHATGVHVLC